ncbi:hypothetical protein GCM10011529_12360 [Polymorphobacter glacialis]|uniref:Transporter n=1 Tax=Sandarakinorhabdus glacialis TaxID=1614636 RepID=A0A916ZP59_9SPHN|nr:transporter [Polymorphobacter glacialis]GGE07488.1 hypothetical protein GCM10011529_12360 [Polymorphobacter glacialis]
MISLSKTPVWTGAFSFAALLAAAPALAQSNEASDLQQLRAEIAAERQALQAQKARLDALESRLLTQLGAASQSPAPAGSPAPTQVASAAPPPAADVSRPVGQAPEDQDRAPEVAVLADQGGVITQPGRLTLEGSIEYARADRNRAIFRGIEVPQSVLVGTFDINENRQDILTAAITARLGITGRFEINGRLPYVYRSDSSVLAPIVANPADSSAGTTDVSAEGRNIGDVEFGFRYQVTDGRGGKPFLIAGVQAVAPTGTDPFEVPRNGAGVATEAATGAGFWGVTPSVTALLPTDPAVLFATLGYTYNFDNEVGGRRINTDTVIDLVDPGNALQLSAGVGISLNQRTAVSFGYAHNWSFGSTTTGRATTRDPINGTVIGETPFTTELRDLQLGRFLFGVSYRASQSTTINWNVEVGATRDAADVRTTLRIPFSFGVF